MTDLLVLLWLGDVSANVAGLMFVLAGVGFGGLFIWTVSSHLDNDEPIVTKPRVWMACVCLLTALLCVLIPSRQWFYMAAGGVATVKALDSTIGQKVTKLVEQKLDEAIGEVQK